MDELRIISKELKDKLDKKEDIFLLDVRNFDEHQIAKIPGSMLIPLDQLENRLNEIPKNKEIIVYCHHGARSLDAVNFLKEKGFKAKSLVGGIDVWARFIDHSIPIY